jgi:hypothetical protein
MASSRSRIAIVAFVLGALLSLPASPAAAHEDSCPSRTHTNGAVLFGDSIGMTMFDYEELTDQVEPAASAGYLTDWYAARGWDVCNLAGPNQSDIGHWEGTGSADPLTDDQPEDVITDTGETLPSWITDFLFDELNAGEGEHVDLTGAIDAFDPDVVVLESAAQTWAFTLVVEWYTAWQDHGGSLPPPTTYQDVDNSPREMLEHLPTWPGPGTFLDHVDEVAADRLTAMSESFAGAMTTTAEDRDIVWLQRPPVDTEVEDLDPETPFPGLNAAINRDFYDPIYRGANRTLVNEIDGTTIGGPGTGEVELSVESPGIDDAGDVRRIDPASGHDQYLVTNGVASFLDGHHLSDWGGWRAAHNLCLALGDGYTADSGLQRCRHLNEVSRVLQSHPWTGDSSPEAALDWVSTYGLMDGTSATTFAPNTNITRGQAARFAYRVRGEPDPTGLTEPWTDISTSGTSAWLVPAAKWLANTSPAVMSGYSTVPPCSTTPCFRPGDTISRGEAVRMAYRFAGEPSVAGLTANTYSDVDPWLDDAVTWATNNWATVGQFVAPVDATHFQPGWNIFRGTFVRMFHELAQTSTAWDTDVPVIWSQQFS